MLVLILCFYVSVSWTGCVKPCFAGEDVIQEKKVQLELGGKESVGVLDFLHWNHPWNHYQYPDRESLEKAAGLMNEAGVGWMRMDFLWGEIEPKQGQFEFAKYDEIVEILLKNNIKILGILHYSADWASDCGKWNCPPRENKFFLDYAKAVISRYKDRVKYWEIWNEPDSHIYWSKQDGLKRYSILLKEVYLAAKQIDPDCKILNGGLANGMASVNHLYDNGAKDYFDILNIHIFQSPLDPDSIKRVAAYPKLARKLMDRKGDKDKKIWVTEIGCPGVAKGIKVKNWWMGDNPGEDQQAAWAESVFKELLGNPAVEKVFWAFFRDTDKHWNDGTDYFGLLRHDFSKKPAFYIYQKYSFGGKLD